MADDSWSDEWMTGRVKQLALWSAVDKGDLTSVRAMIDRGMDVNTTDMHGNIVLHTAVNWQSSDVVRELIEAGSDVNQQNDNGQTSLHLASDRGKAYAVLLLLESMARCDIKPKYSEMTPLHLAAKSGHHNVVRLLLDHGANVNIRDCIGKVPEFYAANILTKQEFEQFGKKKLPTEKRDNKPYGVKTTVIKENVDRDYNKKRQSVSIIQNSDKSETKPSRTYDKQPTPNPIYKGHQNQTQKGQTVRFESDMRRDESESMKFKQVNSKTDNAYGKNVNWKIEFSKEHKARMATNVFDRLAGKKK